MKIALIVLVTVLFAGCTMHSDIVVVSKSMRQAENASAAVPDEFAVHSAGQLYWVEGTVQNTGTEEAKKVEITFVGTDGTQRSLLIASIASIPAGATVPFATARTMSTIHMQLADDEPEIRVGR